MDEDVESEGIAMRLAFEYVIAPLIATHPDRDQLLNHLRRYRAQVVSSRDRTDQSLAEILDRMDTHVRSLASDFPAPPSTND